MEVGISSSIKLAFLLIGYCLVAGNKKWKYIDVVDDRGPVSLRDVQ